ncbi:MAG: hypothetical protein IJH64_10595 [Oscillospiraceae bacterium]|jgi:high-affinity Fe2+/Pb2+ permease|nr:hypothetical protein [Oscillospiraceae bacterium]MBR0450599.1 hypothetical protein [Oscillospiraceae bacterium]
MKKTLYERKVGKEFRATGTYKATPQEDLTIKILGGLFAGCCIMALFFSFFFSARIAVLFFILTFVFAFAMGGYMFYVVWKKSRQEPMEKHYYDVNYKYNGITGETDDRTREITKEEFLGDDRKV